MRYILIAALALSGCKKEPELMPAVCVAMGFAAASEVAPDPSPSEECDTCGGVGYLGDGTVRVDCPDCEVPWKASLTIAPEFDFELVMSTLSRLEEKLDDLTDRVNQIDQSQCPIPVLDIQDARALAEQLWEEFKSGYMEEFKSVINGGSKKPILQIFIDDYEKASVRAAQENVPLLLVFGSRSCRYCESLKSAQESVRVEDVVVCRLYVEDNPLLFRSYGIKSYPTQVMRYASREVQRASGAQDRNAFYRWLEQGKAKAKTLAPR